MHTLNVIVYKVKIVPIPYADFERVGSFVSGGCPEVFDPPLSQFCYGFHLQVRHSSAV